MYRRPLVFLVLLILVISGILDAKDSLTFTIKVDQSRLVLGIPFPLTMSIKSPGQFTLYGAPGWCDSSTTVVVTDSSGNISQAITEVGCPSGERGPFDSDGKKTYSGLVQSKAQIFMLPGKYTIQANYHSHGPFLDRYAPDDIRPVEGIWEGDITSNQIQVEVLSPEGEDLETLLDLGPSASDASLQGYAMFLNGWAEKILETHPKSIYAAHVLWRKGLGRYEGVKEFGVQNDISAQVLNAKACGGDLRCIDSLNTTAQAVIAYWEQLYKDFPNFVYRDQLLFGLSRAHIVLGQHEKAVPFLTELMQRYANTESGKKALPYKQALQSQNIWKGQ